MIRCLVRLVSSGLIVALVAGRSAGAGAPLEQPSPGGRYRGVVRMYGRLPDAGTVIVAYADGREVARAAVQRTVEAATYELLVPADNAGTVELDGAREGEPLSFRVGDVPADEQAFFHTGEDRVLDLHVTRVEICVAAFEDLDRSGRVDPGEPWLAGVTINVAQFFVVRTYTTTGQGEPSCALHEAHPTVVRAVDWPSGYEPPTGQGQPAVTIDPAEGSHRVLFGFVRLTSAVDTPTPLPSLTPATSATPTASATPTPAAELSVDSFEDPGEPGDAHLTLREAIRLVVGDLWLEDLSAAELRRVVGAPGADSRDRIVFDAAVFPADQAVTIEIQPPISSRMALLGGFLPATLHQERPNSSLPALSTGGDTIDGSGNRVILSAGQSLELFDGLVITSDDNSLRGLELRNFDTAILVSGGARHNTLGGRGPEEGLTIVNNIVGVELVGPGVRENRLIGSRIGVERSGHAGPGNATYGVRIADGASANAVGEPGAGNLISGNYVGGVAVLGSGSNANTIVGNLIGTDASGRQALGNGIGVVVGNGAQGTRIGGSRPNDGNVISGNIADGIWVQSPGTSGTQLQGNAIGAGLQWRWAVPNGGCGVLISDGASGTIIGGSDVAQGNRIAFNDDCGVRIRGRNTSGHSVLGNSITGNRGPGIDLAGGGNGGIAGPRLQRLAPGTVEGLTLAGALVQVYSDSDDEGAVLEGVAQADSRGRFRLDLVAPPQWPVLTGTTTDGTGSTSPFAREIAPPTETSPAPTATGAPEDATPATATPSGTPLATEPTTPVGTAPTTALSPLTVTPVPTGNGTPGSTATAEPTAGSPATPHTSIYLPVVYRDALLFSTLTIRPTDVLTSVGSEIGLEIHVDQVSDLAMAYFELAYPAAFLTVLDGDPLLPEIQIDVGSFPDPVRIVVVDNRVDQTEGRIYYGFAVQGGQPVSGSGVMARIRMSAVAIGQGEVAWLEARLVGSGGRRLPLSTTGARILVLEATATVPLPTATTAPGQTPGTQPPTAVPTETAGQPPTAVPTGTPELPPTAGPTSSRTPPPTLTATATEPTPPGPSATATPLPTLTATATEPTAPGPSATATPLPTLTAVPTEPTAPGPSATVTPLAATATHTASPTTSAPPPGPTASATPVDWCSRPLVSGDFEQGFGWRLRGARPPRFVATPVHGGERSVLLGILPGEPNELNYSTLWQSLEVPLAARSMAVNAWTFQAAEPGGGPDRQLLLVYDVDPDDNVDFQRAPIARVVSERSDVRAWQRRALTFDVTAYRGRTLWLYATVLNDGRGGRAWMVLDDLEVVICP